MTLPVRFLYSTHAGCGSATQTLRPSTRNLMSTASACRVARATIIAWYTQCTGFLVQRSVAVKSANMHKTIARVERTLLSAALAVAVDFPGVGDRKKHRNQKTRTKQNQKQRTELALSGAEGSVRSTQSIQVTCFKVRWTCANPGPQQDSTHNPPRAASQRSALAGARFRHATGRIIAPLRQRRPQPRIHT